MRRKHRPIIAYFLDRVEIDESCWNWTGSFNSYGYGKFHVGTFPGVGSRDVRAHRFAYGWLVGAIPPGLTLDHLCRNRACVNPAHLEPVTPVENTMRGVGVGPLNARKTHCVHGHAFTPENTWYEKNGRRHCRTCHRERQRNEDTGWRRWRCPKGHVRTPDNTVVRKNGLRYCKTCATEAAARRKAVD